MRVANRARRSGIGYSVFPNVLRIYFLYDRKLLAKLSVSAWKVMNAYLRSVVSDTEAVPGASIAVQNYGDFLNVNPHRHAIATEGCFLDDGSFRTAPGFILEDLEEIFQYEVLKMQICEALTVVISQDCGARLVKWHQWVTVNCREKSARAGGSSIGR